MRDQAQAWLPLLHIGSGHLSALANWYNFTWAPIFANAQSEVERLSLLRAIAKTAKLHARRLTLPHPSSGMLILEAPLSPEMKAGFARFGFDEHEADPEPFGRKRR